MAERIGTLDIMSKGRVEFGTGRSSSDEHAGFELEKEETREMWQEALEIIPRMWATDEFSYKGKYFDIPKRNIIPKPIQKPHPPIWVAATSPESWEIAGRNGIGVLGMTLFVSVPQIADRVLCLVQFGEFPHDAVMKSLELFGKYIIPRFDP